MAAGKTGLAKHENQHKFPLGWSSMPRCGARLRPRVHFPQTPLHTVEQRDAPLPEAEVISESSATEQNGSEMI